jgi:hypothetical protein
LLLLLVDTVNFEEKHCQMGDLEETIFQRNVPGKYSTWESGERSDRRNDNEDTTVDEKYFSCIIKRCCNLSIR